MATNHELPRTISGATRAFPLPLDADPAAPRSGERRHLPREGSRTAHGLRLLLLASAALISSCSGGGGGDASPDPPDPSEAIAGDWNFFRKAEEAACNDFEYAILPMRTVAISPNQVRVLIGDPGFEFEFTGTYDPETLQLTVEGSDTVEDTTISITSAVWQADPDRNVLTGSMEVVRTEPFPGGDCPVLDTIRAYRQDSTQSSPLHLTGGDENAFDLTLEVLASDSAERIGRVDEVLAAFYPQRAGFLTLEVYSSLDDSSVYFEDVRLMGQSLVFPPADVEGRLQVVNTDLHLSLFTNSISGTMTTFDDADGMEVLEFIATPYLAPRFVDNLFTVESPPNAGGVFSVDPETLEVDAIDLGGDQGSFEPAHLAYVTLAQPDPLRGRYRGVHQPRLYYVRQDVVAGQGQLRRASTDAGTQSYDVIDTSVELNHTFITDLWVENDWGGGGSDFVSFTTNENPADNGAEIKSYIYEVAGDQVSGPVQIPGRPIAARRDVVTGEFQGWITLASSTGLVLRNPSGQVLTTLDPDAPRKCQYLGSTENGDLFFTNYAGVGASAMIQVLRAGSQFLDTVIGGGMASPLSDDVFPADVEGDTLYVMTVAIGQLVIRAFTADGGHEVVAIEDGIDGLDHRAEILVAGPWVAYTFIQTGSVEPCVLKCVRTDGTDGRELDRVGGHIDLFAANERRVYYNDFQSLNGDPASARARAFAGSDPYDFEHPWGSQHRGVVSRPSIEVDHGPRWLPGQGSQQSGAAVTELVPGLVLDSVLLDSHAAASGLIHHLYALEAKELRFFTALFNSNIPEQSHLRISEVTSGFQRVLLAEVEDTGFLQTDIYQFDFDDFGGFYFEGATSTSSIDERVLGN